MVIHSAEFYAVSPFLDENGFSFESHDDDDFLQERLS
jgi:hypothetical protein